MKKDSKIYVAGHRGLVGSALARALQKAGFENVIARTHAELDLTDEHAVRAFFEKEKPEYVFLAAAKVGGIHANNTHFADFIHQNLAIENNVIHNAYLARVKKLLFLGSSCIYPKLSPQPIKEEYLLTGPLEETNTPYSIAKIAGAIMCKSYNKQYGTNFITAMPANLYGPNDNFDLQSSHVVPALMRKFHEAKENQTKEVIVWGSGKPLREFLHTDDLAAACIFLMEHYDDSEIINVGSGTDISIKELAEEIKKITGFQGKIVWDSTKPDGTPRKLLDVSKIRSLGWRHTTELSQGIKDTYDWFLQNISKLKMKE